MKTKEIIIGEKKFIIKELSLDDSLELGELKGADITRKLLQLSIPSLTDEERKGLTMKEGLELVKAINEFNGLTEDFISSLKTG